MKKILEKIGKLLNRLFLAIYFCKYRRRRLYKKMATCKEISSLSGLCSRFQRFTGFFDFKEYLRKGYLPELKRACEEHHTFHGFEYYYFFDENETYLSFNEIRIDVLEKAILLCND